MSSTQVRPGGDRELRVHDGIWLAGVTSAAMIQSAFTGWCPMHFILSKVMPSAG
jgi:hypothetical protein